jgi:transcriptional regulator with XRE-family HTH domain
VGIFGHDILFTIRLVMRNIVGPRVRQARKMAKPPITQLDLVARLQLLGSKVDQSAVSKIEKGVRPVLDVEVVALAKALRVSPAWLLGERDATISTGQG